MNAHSVGATSGGIPYGQVVVILGTPDERLVAGLRTVGLAPVAKDGEVVVWGRAPVPTPPAAPAPAPGPAAGGGTTRLLMTIRDAAEALGLGRSTVYELIGRGDLEVVHVGRSARVPADAVRAFVTGLRSEDDGHGRQVG